MNGLALDVTPIRPVGEPRPRSFELINVSTLDTVRPIAWRIKGLLEAESVACIYGPPGSGKSFLVLSLCAAIAEGHERWFGFRVIKSPVVYCALEGAGGFRLRLAAYRQANGSILENFWLIEEPFDLRNPDDHLGIIESISAIDLESPVIFLDTLSSACPGINENATEEMGLAIEAAKIIQRGTGGLVVLVHHTGKAGNGPRGSSVINGNCNTLIELEVDEARTQRGWFAPKVKEGAEIHDRHSFVLEVVTLGYDDDGDEISSCFVIPGELVGPIRKETRARTSGKLNKAASKVLEILTVMLTENEDRLLASGKNPDIAKVQLSDLRRRCLDEGAVSHYNRFKGTFGELKTAERIIYEDPYVWLP